MKVNEVLKRDVYRRRSSGRSEGQEVEYVFDVADGWMTDKKNEMALKPTRILKK